MEPDDDYEDVDFVSGPDHGWLFWALLTIVGTVGMTLRHPIQTYNYLRHPPTLGGWDDL